MVDDQDIDWNFSGVQFHSHLLTDGGEQIRRRVRGSAGLDGLHSDSEVLRIVRCPGECEVVSSGEAGLIDDGTVEHKDLQQMHEVGDG